MEETPLSNRPPEFRLRPSDADRVKQKVVSFRVVFFFF